MKLRFLWHSKVLLLSTVSLNTLFILTHFAIFGKKESVSLKEVCNEKKNTKGVSPLTMTDSPIRKTFTGNVSSTYNFCFSSDRNLPHASGLGEEWHLNCWVEGISSHSAVSNLSLPDGCFCLNSKYYTFLHWGIVFCVYIFKQLSISRLLFPKCK